MSYNDPIGKASLDYLYKNSDREDEITVLCSVTEEDVIPVAYLFRGFKEMPKAEQTALKESRGKILVVGAGAGCHSLWLEQKGLDVFSIDISKGAVEAMRILGVQNASVQDFFSIDESVKFDTVLALMNGIGIAGDLEGLPSFLQKVKSILAPNGQFLTDSTDLTQLIEEEEQEYDYEDDDYIGELEYKMIYKNQHSDWFKWLYVDAIRFSEIARENQMKLEVLSEDTGYNYLAKLSVL